MKKMLLTTAAFALVAVSGIALVPTKAEAFPAFARQTGAACLSCHFQTFPALNAFGRAFMMGSFTDVGDQALVEDDNLSIPAVLNASFEVRGGATNTSSSGAAPSDTTYTIPNNARLFLAGRIGSNSGAVIVFTGKTPVWMFLNSWDVGDFKVGLSAQKSPWGGSNIMEGSNVFGHRGDKLGGQDISATTNSGFTKQTTSIGTWIGNDLGVVQVALLAPASTTTGGTNVGLNFGKLIRAYATLDVGGWDTLVGFGYVTGTAGKANGGASGPAAARIPMSLNFVYAQAQGEVGDMSIGVYGDWPHAKGKTSSMGTGNFYGVSEAFEAVGADNVAGNKFDAFSIRADIEPIDRFLFGVGYAYQKMTRPGGDLTNKVFHLAATYKLYQNFDVNVVFNNEKLSDSIVPGNSGTTRTTIVEVDALM